MFIDTESEQREMTIERYVEKAVPTLKVCMRTDFSTLDDHGRISLILLRLNDHVTHILVC